MNQTIKKRIEQIGRGEVPEGYKKTKVGIVPCDWELTTFGRITQKTGKRGSKSELETLPICSINNQVGFCRQNEQFENEGYSNTSKDLYVTVNRGEFAYNPARINVGSIGLLKKEERALISSLYVCFKLNPSHYNIYFEYYFKSHRFNFDVNNYTEGSVRQYLFYDNFSRIRVVTPSLAEQEKIAEILGTQDKLIALKEKRIAEKKQQKKYLMQQLLTGKKRLPGFTSEWKMIKLGECCEIIKGDQLNKNTLKTDGEFYVLNGGITPSGYVDKWNVLENTISISEGGNSCGFVNYNKIKFWSGGHNYTLQNIGECILNLYLYQFLKANENNIMDLRVGSGLPNIQKEALLNFKVFIPNLFEQQGIADILSQADKEIELLQKDLEEEKNKKKALMQLLLTGIVRVS